MLFRPLPRRGRPDNRVTSTTAGSGSACGRQPVRASRGGSGNGLPPRSRPRCRAGPPAAREAFDRALDALDDWDEPATGRLAAEVRRARSLRELWHLRNEVYTRLAVRHCEHLARERLARIDAAL
ncbi:hypothetical protein ABXN37_27965, partial [Piscinibacter sakaiensis]